MSTAYRLHAPAKGVATLAGHWIIGANELDEWWPRGTRVEVVGLVEATRGPPAQDPADDFSPDRYRVTGVPWTGTAPVYVDFSPSEMRALTRQWRRP